MTDQNVPTGGASRVRWAILGAVAALLLLGLIWGISSLIRSPQQVLAEADPPPPSQITFPIKTEVIGGESELVVPISAVFTASDGHATVIVIRDGQEVAVAVDPGSDHGGFVDITAIGGDLAAGDEVLVSEPRQ